jgi:hypothetical protein
MLNHRLTDSGNPRYSDENVQITNLAGFKAVSMRLQRGPFLLVCNAFDSLIDLMHLISVSATMRAYERPLPPSPVQSSCFPPLRAPQRPNISRDDGCLSSAYSVYFRDALNCPF